MIETKNFPNGGYEVTVYSKKDILDCIEENIIDKEVALELITQCEFDAANYINNEIWASLPYIGNVRVPKADQLANSKEQKELLENAKNILPSEQYVLFKRAVIVENTNIANNTKYFNYVASMAVNKNKSLYKKLCKTKGELYARIFLFSTKFMQSVSSNIEDNE